MFGQVLTVCLALREHSFFIYCLILQTYTSGNDNKNGIEPYQVPAAKLLLQ